MIGFLVSMAIRDERTISWRLYHGVAQGIDSEGRFCIDSRDSGVLCGRPRLEEGAELPDGGKPVRAAYVKLPSDTSYPPEPSWLWVTELACTSDTEDAPACADASD